MKLNGTPAQLVSGIGDGVKKIATLFNITRIYNSTCSVAQMRRSFAWAESYSSHRFAFGRNLIEHNLHRELLAELKTKYMGCLSLVMFVASLLGKEETNKAKFYLS